MGLRQRLGVRSVAASLVASLLVAAPAWAAQPKVVVVVVPTTPAAQQTAGRVDYVTRQAVERSGRFELVRLIDALDAENAAARERRVKDGEAALAVAKSAYNDLDTNKALAEADKAIKAFSEADLTQHLKELVGAWIFKIASLIANGENKAAQMEMDKLLVVDPTAQFSRDYFPPDDLAYAEKVRAQYAHAAQSLEVKTVPEGAEVFVDGRFQGISPVTAMNLVPGDHFVTVKAPGYLLGQQKARPGSVEIALRKAEAAPRYEALTAKVAKDPDGPQRDAAAREFGQWLGVDQVLLAVVDLPAGAKQARLTALRLDPADGHNWAYAQERIPTQGGELLQKADAVATRLLASDDPRRGGPVTHYLNAGAGQWKKTAGYVLLGTGAAALVGGVVFGLQANSRHTAFHNTVQTDLVRSNSLKSSGRTYAVVADLSYLTGVVAAGAGTWLAFFSNPKTPATAPAAPAVKPAAAPEKKPQPATVSGGTASPPPPAVDTAQKKQPESERKKTNERRRRSEDEDDLRNY